MDEDEFSDTSQILPENTSVFDDVPDADDSVNSDALMDLSHNDSFDEFAAPSSSTPGKNTLSPRRSSRKRTPVNRLEVAPVPARVQRPTTTASRSKAKSSDRLKCPKCPSTYANKRTLDIHLRSHLMAGVTSRLPDVVQLTEAMPSMLKKVLNDIYEEKAIGESWTELQKTVKELLSVLESDTTGSAEELYALFSETFYKVLTSKKLLFPSALRSTVYVATNGLLSSNDFISKVKNFLQVLYEVPGNLINILVGNIVFLLSKKILILRMQVMRNCSVGGEPITDRRKRSCDKSNDPTFRKLVYHIGGSTIHGFVWKAKEYSKTSQLWARILNVLESKFIASTDKQNECVPEVQKLTVSKDRGGLTHSSDAAFEFFLFLHDLLMSLESEDGSFPQNIIDDKVLSNDVLLCLWDVIVGDDLSPDESLDLLIQIVQASLKIVVKGIMKRRLNKYLKKAYSSVALRPGLAKN